VVKRSGFAVESMIELGVHAGAGAAQAAGGVQQRELDAGGVDEAATPTMFRGVVR
jgi:hypothetical protein